MTRTVRGIALLVVLGIVVLGESARACTDVGEPGAACDDTTTSNLIEENDSFIDHHDKHYTQGLRLSFASSEQTPGDVAYPWLRAMFKQPEAQVVAYFLVKGRFFFLGVDEAITAMQAG